MSQQSTAVITGASSGFGYQTALAFAGDGWRVYGTMRKAADGNAEAAAKLRGAGVSVVELDVTSDESVDAASKLILSEAGAVDVLVNNAGTGFFGIQEAFTPAAAEQQFATNVIGPLRVNRAFLPSMRERRSGLVVYVSSVVGRFVLPFGGIYASSKWALEAQAQAAAYELAPFSVDVAVVEPGAYPTEIFGKVKTADDTARVASYGEVAARLEALSNGRLGELAQGRDPKDVALAILRIAKAPAGTRPFRTTVPEDAYAGAINAAVEPIQRQIIEAFGLGELLPKQPVTA
jgi:NAD(P)-dependent dehydrogenase (short-subunit alcohol dehydrogenase family)